MSVYLVLTGETINYIPFPNIPNSIFVARDLTSLLKDPLSGILVVPDNDDITKVIHVDLLNSCPWFVS